MKYCALLRGINVGGNNIIKMADLKNAVQDCGFTNVSTYIQSGNLIFESAETNQTDILSRLEACLSAGFSYHSTIVVKNQDELKTVLAEVPDDWVKRSDLRCYIVFLGHHVSIRDIAGKIELKDGIDFIKTGKDVLYMSTLISGLTRSRFTKLVSLKVYKDLTTRNYNTTRKLLELMK
jgi:uncharacterized protein (DUF1697 family)